MKLIQCQATFQKALFISLGIHLVIFGSALAFAHFGNSLFSGGFRSITVSLVGPGKAGLASSAAPRSKPAEGSQPLMQEQQRIAPATPRSTNESISLDDAPGKGDSRGEDNPGTGEGVGNGLQKGTNVNVGGQREIFSPEQWQLLQAAIEKAKTYPRLARERGVEGVVLVRFKVLPSGDIDTVNIVKSSGSKILDAASMQTVYRAAPMPYVNGWVDVPMTYVLK